MGAGSPATPPLIEIGEVTTHSYFNRFKELVFPAYAVGYLLIPTEMPVTEDPERFLGDVSEDLSQKYLVVAIPINPKGGMDVNIQDQTTPLLIVKMSRLDFEGFTETEATINTVLVDVPVADFGNYLVGSYISIFSKPDNRFYIGTVLEKVGTNTLRVDTPFDFSYPIGSDITAGITNMADVSNVGASQVAPVYYRIRNTDPADRIPSQFDIVRIQVLCLTTAAVDLSKFGDIVGGIANGIVLRRTDGTNANIFNVKTNGDFATLAYDWTPYSAQNVQQGQNGFLLRLTFGGQNKMGVVIRIGEGDDLELILQDNITTLGTFEITAEGHIVD